MSASQYKVNDRRSASGYVNSGSDLLYSGSQQSLDRIRRPAVDRDERRNLSNYGWREMMSAARWIEARCSPIAGAIDQMSRYAIGQGFNVQMLSRNKAWANKAEEALYEWDKICNVKGPNFNKRETLVLLLRTMIIDGDSNILLTGTNPGADDDYPLIQQIPSHRIGSRLYALSGVVSGGEYDGKTIINGAIQADNGRTIAWRVFGDPFLSDEYEDIRADDLHLFYAPKTVEAARGMTWLRTCINDVQDIQEIRDWLKLVVKQESMITLLEKNETGTPSNFALAGLMPAQDPTRPASATNPIVEMYDGGTIRYLKHGKEDIESLKTDRPSPNVLEFSREILRGAFDSIGWPIEFYDPEHVGGAPARQRIAQAILRIEMLQGIARRAAETFTRYAIAKMINLGILEPDVDWWKMDFQEPKNLSVDNGWDAKAALELYKIGAISLERLCEWQGDYWEEVQKQKATEEAGWQQAAKDASVNGIEVKVQDIRILYPNPPAIAVEPTDTGDATSPAEPAPKGTKA